MKYVIKTPYNKEYLASFAIKGSIYPMKSWTNNFDYAIQFNSKEDAKSIINFLKVNTPYTMQIKEIDNDGYAPFSVADLSETINGKALLFFKSAKAYYPARIICRDRIGIKNGAGKPVPLVVLVEHPTEGEILFEATINREAYSAQQGCHQALYIKYRDNG